MDPESRRLLEELAGRRRVSDATLEILVDVIRAAALAGVALVAARAVYRQGLADGVYRGMRHAHQELEVPHAAA